MTSQIQIPVHRDEANNAVSTGPATPAATPPDTAMPASPAGLKPLPQPRYVVIDESQFVDELYKMDPESELALAEAGLAEYLEQCPPY